MMVDTDVLIWYLRGNDKAKAVIDGLETFSISSVVYMELLQGIRNKNELKLLKQFIKHRAIENVHIDTDITSKAIYFLEGYALSHGLRLADALIAATADVYGRTLLTGNYAHYKPIHSLSVKKFTV